MSERPDEQTRLADAPGMVGASPDRLRVLAEQQAAVRRSARQRVSRDDLSVLVEQQAALRRVATLVAAEVSSSELLFAVANEMGRCLNLPGACVCRYENDSVVVLAVDVDDPSDNEMVSGTRFALGGENVATSVLRTGRPARLDSHENATGAIGEQMRLSGVGSIVGVPIIVAGQVWGMAAAAAQAPEVVPPDAEAWIGDFADLLATAIVNAATRDQLYTLAEQQAALRRIATLVAQGASPDEVFSVVAKEIGRCLQVPGAAVSRYEQDAVVVLAMAPVPPRVKDMVPPRVRFPLGGDNVATKVCLTKQPVRMDSYDDATGTTGDLMRQLGARCTVAVPILVGDRVWGMASCGTNGDKPMPADTEERLTGFADLVGTSIANAEAREQLDASRDRLRELVRHQTGLRRVAELVARASAPAEVFAAVAEEMANCVDAYNATVARFESDEIIIEAIGRPDFQTPDRPAVGERFPMGGDHIAPIIARTGRPARMDSHEHAAGATAARIRDIGIQSMVGVPIIVGAQVWGVVAVASRTGPLPADTEARMADFADLVGTSIANAATRAELQASRHELIASRARIVAAADDARRRIERDLHDGAQQRLVSLGLQLRLAEGSVPPEQPLKEQLSGIVSGLTAVSSDLQEISRGIHPAILSEGGLGPALKALARRCPIPTNVDVLLERRLPESVEVAAYYVVAEALTNAAKYAQASQVSVCAEIKEDTLCLSIQDDGIGGADSRKGSGLIGLKDRVEVLGGHMKVISPPGSGTALHVTIPLTAE